MDFNGRPMPGFVEVDPAACEARALQRRVALTERAVGELPAKKSRAEPGFL